MKPTKASSSAGCVVHDLVQIFRTESPFCSASTQTWTVVPLLLSQAGFRMFVVPSLLELVFVSHSMAMKTVAARRSSENLPPTTSTAVMSFLAAIIMKSDARGECLRGGHRRWSLNIASVGIHGHTLPDLRNAILVVMNRARSFGGSSGPRKALLCIQGSRTRVLVIRWQWCRSLSDPNCCCLRRIRSSHIGNSGLCI